MRRCRRKSPNLGLRGEKRRRLRGNVKFVQWTYTGSLDAGRAHECGRRAKQTAGVVSCGDGDGP